MTHCEVFLWLLSSLWSVGLGSLGILLGLRSLLLVLL